MPILKDIESIAPLPIPEALPMRHVIALGDPNFPDMEDWLNVLDDVESNHPNVPQTDVSAATAVPASAKSDNEKMDIEQAKLGNIGSLRPPSLQEASGTDIMSVDKVNGGIVEMMGPKRARSATMAAADTAAVPKHTKVPPIPSPTELTLITPKSVIAHKAKVVTKQAEEPTSATVGISRSAVARRKLQADMEAGTHTINKTRQQNFKDECLVADSLAKFRFEGADWLVFHSSCGKWQKMTEGYASSRFRTHVNKCPSTGTSAKFTTLSGFFPKAGQEKTTKALKATTKLRSSFHPCSGITEEHDERVPIFIRRTGADGGGARSVTAIAMELFDTSYGTLSSHDKLRVDRTQTHEWSFRFDHRQLAIYSTACEKTTSVLDNSNGPHTCRTCLTLYAKDQRFKSGLRVATPDDENYRHLNEIYRGKSDGERYAKTQGLQALFEDKVYSLAKILTNHN
jgi:hypothetical protein